MRGESWLGSVWPERKLEMASEKTLGREAAGVLNFWRRCAGILGENTAGSVGGGSLDCKRLEL